MKDVEMTATLLLLLEEGTKSTSVETLDEAFSTRDQEWDEDRATQDEFRNVIEMLAVWINHGECDFLPSTRFRNQADFYSLFGAVAQLTHENSLPSDIAQIGQRLKGFLDAIEDEEQRQQVALLGKYWDASRSSTNDKGPRDIRIGVVKKVLKGEPLNGK